MTQVQTHVTINYYKNSGQCSNYNCMGDNIQYIELEAVIGLGITLIVITYASSGLVHAYILWKPWRGIQTFTVSSETCLSIPVCLSLVNYKVGKASPTIPLTLSCFPFTLILVMCKTDCSSVTTNMALYLWKYTHF